MQPLLGKHLANASRLSSMALWIAIAFVSFGVAPSVSAMPNDVAMPLESRSFNVSYRISVVPRPGRHKVNVWVPIPSTDRFQTISGLRLKVPASVHIRKDPTYGDRYAFFSMDRSRSNDSFEIQLSFHVVRFERRPQTTGDRTSAFAKEVTPYLQPDRLGSDDRAIVEFAREQTQGISDPLQKARKIYDVMLSMIHCDEVCVGDNGTSALAAVTHHGGWTDPQSLFTSMLRTVGIPARLEMGFSLPEAQTGGTIAGYHSWVEFYADGIGWIPVDVSGKGPASQKGDFLFGAIDANRVMLSMGRDLAVTPAPKAGPLTFTAYPYIEVDGQPFLEYSADCFFRETGIAGAITSISRKPIFAETHFSTTRQIPHLPS